MKEGRKEGGKKGKRERLGREKGKAGREEGRNKGCRGRSGNWRDG